MQDSNRGKKQVNTVLREMRAKASKDVEAKQKAKEKDPERKEEPSVLTPIAEPEVQAPESKIAEAPPEKVQPSEPEPPKSAPEPEEAPEPPKPEPKKEPAVKKVSVKLTDEEKGIDPVPEEKQFRKAGRPRGPHAIARRTVRYVDMGGNRITGFCLRSAETGKAHPLKESSIIGNAEDADIILGDRFVSQHHAKITELDGQFFLEDLSSTNGTRVNGTRLDPGKAIPIEIGSMIIFGAARYTLEPASAAKPAAEETRPEPASEPAPEPEQPEPAAEETPEAPAPSAPEPPAGTLALVRLDTGEVYDITRDLTVGRDEDNDICIPEPDGHYVSGHHATIVVDGRDIRVRDRDGGSSNGTFVNGTRIKNRRIYKGNTIKFANVEFEVFER